MNYQTSVSVDEKSKKEETKKKVKVYDQKPTSAFIGASWSALLIGMVSYCIGLWNADMMLNEKGYYFTILLFGYGMSFLLSLFAAIAVQKNTRDVQYVDRNVKEEK